MNTEKQHLIEEHQALAYKFGHKMWWKYLPLRRVMDLDDFLAEAMYSLVKAAEAFDPSKGFRFSTLAYTTMENHFRDLWKMHKTPAYSFTELRATMEDTSLEEFFPHEEPFFEMVEILEDFSRFLKTCNDKEKALLRLLLQGHTQKECATLLVEQEVMKTCSQPAIFYMINKLSQRVNEVVLCS